MYHTLFLYSPWIIIKTAARRFFSAPNVFRRPNMFHCLLELIWFNAEFWGTLQGPGSSLFWASTVVDPSFLVFLQNPSDSSWPELDLHEPTQALINLSAGVVIVALQYCINLFNITADRRRINVGFKRCWSLQEVSCCCSASKSINKVCVSPRTVCFK